MYRYRSLVVLLAIIFCTLPAFAHHLAVVVPQTNHAAGISSAELGRILKSETRKWPDGSQVLVVITRNSIVTLQMLEQLFGMSEAAVKALIVSHPGLFVQADSDAAALAIVESKPGALGLVDVHALSGAQVRVLKIDGKLPMELGYLPH